MKWLDMTGVIVVAAAWIALVIVAARWTERRHMAEQHPLPRPETLSVVVDPQGRIVEVATHGAGRPLQGKPGDPGPATWQDLEPDYDILSERVVTDDAHGQVKLLQLRVKQQ
jgi:hypothetical protein